ncbi:MAG TPA: adenylyltransferase/cytidyltransferase family protein, partial [Gaiellaceae bacterium]
MITAIYPGTYDPVTNGHVDVITRAAKIFDRVVVGVVDNPHHKVPMFAVPERVDFLEKALDGVVENVEVAVF